MIDPSNRGGDVSYANVTIFRGRCRWAPIVLNKTKLLKDQSVPRFVNIITIKGLYHIVIYKMTADYIRSDC